MKRWETDGSIDADTRLPGWLKRAFRQRWIPDWALGWLWELNKRGR